MIDQILITDMTQDEWTESADIWDEIAKIKPDDFSRLWEENGGGWDESAENEPEDWPDEEGDEQC